MDLMFFGVYKNVVCKLYSCTDAVNNADIILKDLNNSDVILRFIWRQRRMMYKKPEPTTRLSMVIYIKYNKQTFYIKLIHIQ